MQIEYTTMDFKVCIKIIVVFLQIFRQLYTSQTPGGVLPIKGYRDPHPIYLGLKATKIPYFWVQNFQNSESIFLALRISENLNFHIFRIQIILDLKFKLTISINKAVSVVSQT